jgi:hypothetical protein
MISRRNTGVPELVTLLSMLRLLRSRPLALGAGLWLLAAGGEPPFPHP